MSIHNNGVATVRANCPRHQQTSEAIVVDNPHPRSQDSTQIAVSYLIIPTQTPLEEHGDRLIKDLVAPYRGAIPIPLGDLDQHFNATLLPPSIAPPPSGAIPAAMIFTVL